MTTAQCRRAWSWRAAKHLMGQSVACCAMRAAAQALASLRRTLALARVVRFVKRQKSLCPAGEIACLPVQPLRPSSPPARKPQPMVRRSAFGRCGRPGLGWWLGSWLAAVAVNRAVALIRELAQMNFLTRRDYAGMRLGEIQRIEYFLVDAVVL